jgi:hypothetical protein
MTSVTRTRTARSGRARPAIAAHRLLLVIAALTLAPSGRAWAGNEANFVLYTHHTEEKGEVEFEYMMDFSTDVKGEPPYMANMLEFDYGVTNWWTLEFMAEGQQTEGQDYVNTGWRLENRFRLFPYGTFLNPVIYTEYESLKPETKFLMEVSGRTDAPESPGPEKDERIGETRLILGEDISDRLDAAFNWINETDTRTGDTAFGYVFGLNYTIYGGMGMSGMPGMTMGNERSSSHGEHEGSASPSRLFAVSHVMLGLEMFGGLGDTNLGLTLDPNVTAHYASANLMMQFENGLHLMVGLAEGLTEVSQDRLIRTMVKYEF